MTTTKPYLDTRAYAHGTEAPLKLSICMYGRTTLIPLGIKFLPEYWDAKTQTAVRHPQKQRLNITIQNRKVTEKRSEHRWDRGPSGSLVGFGAERA